MGAQGILFCLCSGHATLEHRRGRLRACHGYSKVETRKKRESFEKKHRICFCCLVFSYGNQKLGLLMNFFSEETGTTAVKLIPKDRMLTAKSNQELPFSSPLDTIAL